MKVKKIGIAGDHAGVELKQKVIQVLESKGFELENFGTDSTDSCDYPDYAHPLAKSVADKENDLGVLICGSGNGVNMTANKYPEVRSALSWTPEIAELGRLHNNANVVAIPARFVSEELALEIIEKFVSTEFEGGRHERRVNKIAIS